MADTPEIQELSQAILKNHDCSLLTPETKNHLAIYQKNYLINLVDSLLHKFCSTVKLLGQNNFKFFAKSFVLANPSLSANIDDYGLGFPEFLGSREELVDISYVEHLARLDGFYFSAHQNGEYIVLPKGILEIWDMLTHDKEPKPVEIDDSMEKIILNIGPSGTSLLPEEI